MRLKKPKKKIATIIASYETDLGLVLNWLRLKKVIVSTGNKRALGNGYAVTVKSKISKKALNDLVKEKFGVFAKVV